MPVIRYKPNGGLAEAGDEAAKRLIDSGLWELADQPKPATRRRAARPKPEQE